MIFKGKIRFRLRFRLGLGVVVILRSRGIYYIRKSPHKVGSTNVCVFTEMLISHPLI